MVLKAMGRRATFAQLLRAYRAAAGLSQLGVAERAGLSRRGVSDLERSLRTAPHPDTVQRLANAMQLSVDQRARLVAAAKSPADHGVVATGTYDSSPALRWMTPPVPVSSFIGRESEVAEVRRLLETTRVLTLTGTGGVGKTRLALEVLRIQAAVAPEGDQLAFLDLSQVSDPDALEHAIAAALRLPEMSSESVLDLLVDMLRGRRWLLALDNSEQLVCGVVRVLKYFLLRCPDLRVLCTSREALGMCGEVAWRVPSLSLPNDHDAQSVAQSEAVQLFVERARATVPRFRITQENAREVAEMCERLDGIPLAIELAAARLGALSIAQIANRLDHLLEMLTCGSTSAPPRHQSLRSSLDWSYRLVSKDEQRLFRRLAVFAGGWTIEAAESACVGDPLEVRDMLDLLGHLVDKSLVQVDQTTAGHARYRFLESHRQYAAESLVESS